MSDKHLKFHQKFYRLTTKKDAIFRQKDSKVPLELHWKTYSTELIFKPHTAWQDAVDAEHYVLYLCLHAAKHGWSRLIWVVDIIKFIDLKSIDIYALQALAKQKKILPVVNEFILLAYQTLGVELVSAQELLALQAYDKRLKKRRYWGKQIRTEMLKDRIKKHYLLNSLSSSAYWQLYLWSQFFLGGVLKRLLPF